MDIYDLIKALQGANITINLQGGTGNTFFAGPAQINQQQYNSAEKERDKPHCDICGRNGGADLESHLVGSVHTHCQKRAADDARTAREEKYGWKVLQSVPDYPEVKSLPEPEKPVERLRVSAIDDRYFTYDGILFKPSLNERESRGQK